MNVVSKILKQQGRRIAAIFVFVALSFSLLPSAVLAVDSDGDGLDSSIDNNDSSALWGPRISYPRENTGIEDSALTIPFRGSGEVGTRVKLFEDEAEICSVDVSGDGIALGGAEAITIDGSTLTLGNIQAQFFYDTATEGSTTWRTIDTASWYTATKDDATDNICDYQLDDGDGDPRSGADDRCGESTFPAKSILVLTDDSLLIFDAELRTLWEKRAISGGVNISALAGKVFVGTQSGLKVFNFSTDNFSTTFSTNTTPAIINASVVGLATKTVDNKDYVFVGTEGGVTLLNITDSSAISKSVSGVAGVSITTENNALYSTTSGTFVSQDGISDLLSDWAVTDISNKVHFSSGLTRKLHQDFVGHAAGVSRIQAGGQKIRNIAKDFATIPLIGDVRGHWFDSITDRSGKGNELSNNNGVVIAPVETDADVGEFSFDGESQYLSSSDEDFDVSGDQITVGMWIRRLSTGGTGDYQKILNHGTSAGSRNYFLSAGDTFFDYPIQKDPYFFGVKTDQGFAAVSVQSEPEVNTWEFIVGTYDGANLKIYKNGSLEKSISHSGDIISNAEELRIGYGYENEYFAGKVMLPFVAATAYTSDQIQELYNLTNNWKAPGAKVTLQTTTSDVQDVACHPEWNTCYIATNTGVTKLDTSTGLTTLVLSKNGIENMVSTRLGTWECSEVMTRGAHSVFARGHVQDNASSKVTNNRRFYAYQPGEVDIDADGLLNDVDNDPFVPIETPVISLVQQSLDDQTAYTFSGTGDNGTGNIRTKIGLFKVGETTPFQSIEVGSNGAWTSSLQIFDSGLHTIFAKAYVGSNASTVISGQTQVNVEALEEGPPLPNVLPEFLGATNTTFSWNKNKTGVLFKAQLAEDSSFLTGIQESGWIPETSYNFQNLENGRKYFFRVKSKDANGEETAYSEGVFTTIDVLSPLGTTVSNSGNYSSSLEITFGWSDFTDSGGSGIDHFEVQISTSSTFATTLFSSAHYETIQKVITGTPGETYFARVKAVDKVGNKSNYVYSAGTKIDNTASTLPVLRQITNPASPGTKTLSWTAAVDAESGIQRYEVWRLDNRRNNEGVLVDSVALRRLGSTTNTSYVDEAIQDGWQYVYKIIAYNGAGASVESKTMQFTVDSTQTAPASFESISHYVGGDDVLLQWTEATDVNSPISYEILRDNEVIGTVSDVSTRQYTDGTSKENGTVYFYQVRAKSSDADGGISEGIKVLIDKTTPVTSSTIEGTSGENGWYISPVLVTLTSSDGEGAVFDPTSSAGEGFISGLDQVLFNKNESGLAPYSVPVPFNTDGTNTLDFYAVDQAENEEVEQSLLIKIDAQSPTAIFQKEEGFVITNGFTKENEISFSVSGTDETSGVSSVITYVRFDENGDGTLAGTNDFGFSENAQSKISTANGATDSGTYVFARDGKYEFKVVVTDNAGNTAESDIVTVNVDRTSPTTIDDAPSIVPAVAPFTIILSPNDKATSSGIDQTYYTIDGTSPTTSSSRGTKVTLTESDIDEDGYFTVKYFSVDKMGNSESIKIATNSPADADEDGMPDDFELTYTDPASETSLEAGDDEDEDGLTNLQEYQNKTNPQNADTDGDSVNDAVEVLDGTDPNSSTDHRVVFLAPLTAVQPTDTPFVFLSRAPIGKTVSIKNVGGSVIGSGVADSSGKVAIELALGAGTTHVLSAEFIHANGQIVSTKAENASDDIQIDVQLSTGTNPKFSNITENDIFAQGFIDVEVKGKANSRMELFEVKNNNLVSLSEAISGENGIAMLGLPTTFIGGQIFVIDQDNRLTSEIIQVYRSVTVNGQVLDAEGAPIKDAIAKFIDGGNHYTTTTDTNGNYTLNIPRNREYVVKIYHRYYEKFEDTLFITDKDPKVSPALDLLPGVNLEQTEDGVVVTDAGGMITRYSGIEREEVNQVTEQPTQTYEESLQEVKKIQEGISGKVKTITTTTTGQEVFGGYQSGRIAVQEYKIQPEVARKITGLLGSERRKGEEAESFYAAAEKSICLTEGAETRPPADIIAADPYAREIYKLVDYGVVQLDEDKNFNPQNEIAWEEVLQSIFAANCLESKSLTELRRDDQLVELGGVSLENTPESLLIYTAASEGILGKDFSAETLPTRKEVLLSMITAFPVEINEKANNTSFTDVSSEDPLAPILVAVKQGNWFDSFPAKEFLPETVLTREVFASWFINALEHKKATTTQKSAFQKFIEKLRGKTEQVGQARPGVRTTSRSEAASHLTGREYREQLAENPRYYTPTRATWNPIDPNTTRKPLWVEDRSDNVKRQEPTKILRDIKKALERVIEKQKETEEQSKKEDDVGMLKRIFRGN